MSDPFKGKPQSVEALKILCNPFKELCWTDLNRPIKKADVQKEIHRVQKGLPEKKSARGNHIRKIAEFALNGWKDPIEIDVGIPHLNFPGTWQITDGNHRFAAAIFRECTTIQAVVSGDVDYAIELGLNP
jgi:hypothetical protein